MIDSKDVSFMIGRLNSCHMLKRIVVHVMWHPNLEQWQCVELSAGVTLQQVVANIQM